MIRFFRRIRQKAAFKGRASKYLAYDLGEVLLVMIGILLALQVNNLKSERIQSLEVKRVLLEISRVLKLKTPCFPRSFKKCFIKEG